MKLETNSMDLCVPAKSCVLSSTGINKTTADDNYTNQPVVQVQINNEQSCRPDIEASRATSWIDVIFKRHMTYDPLMLLFSFFILVLGIIGYVSKGSTPSVISGTLFFIILMMATHVEGVQKNSYPLVATLVVLFIVMTIRYLDKKAFWPSGLVAIISLLMLTRHLYILFARRSLT